MPVQSNPQLSNRQFVSRLATRVERGLAGIAPTLRPSRRGSMLQVGCGWPGLHYEAWLQRGREQIELGLHFEASQDFNARMLRAFAPEMLDIRHELGPEFELEQWTERWGRIHCYLPYTTVDVALIDRVAERMLAMIECLQPRLEDLIDAI
jgi:hypothetical protein